MIIDLTKPGLWKPVRGHQWIPDDDGCWCDYCDGITDWYCSECIMFICNNCWDTVDNVPPCPGELKSI